jgi:ATP-dependent 26S proteasome regulatory subunit
MEYLLLSKISTNNIFYDIGIILLILPILTALKKYFEEDFPRYVRNKLSTRYKWTSISYSGLESIQYAYFNYCVSSPFIALCHYITINNLAKQNYNRNDRRVKYICDGTNIRLNDEIYADINTENIAITEKDSNISSIKKITVIIRSMKHNFTGLKHFVAQCEKEYKIFCEKKNENKLYHFIYQSCLEEGKCPIFSKTLLSDINSVNEKSYETFDTIFSEHKETLKSAVDRLKQDSFYIKTGAKRKAGFLFHGVPGCGKTAHVTAIANYGNRHIIEVPMARVKTNIQLENILALTEINGVTFKRKQVIFLFDEIDQCKELKPRTNEKDDEDKDVMPNKIAKTEIADQLNLGFILSRFDGIGNYAGMIIIATTNCIEALSPALYREGRLTPINFTYCRHEDIVNIIEYRYDIKINSDDLLRIPDRSHKITPTKLLQLIDKNYTNMMNIFNDLQQFPESNPGKLLILC